MRSILYHLVTVQTGTLPGAATIQVIRPCRAYGIKFNCHGVGGAATGRLSFTLEMNNSAQANGDTNNPPRETVLASHAVTFIATSPANGAASGTSPWIPVNVALKPGDILSLNQVQTGTAPASASTSCDVYCTES